MALLTTLCQLLKQLGLLVRKEMRVAGRWSQVILSDMHCHCIAFNFLNPLTTKKLITEEALIIAATRDEKVIKVREDR